jgi:hypothetical protein
MTASDLDASLWAYFTYYGEGRFDHWEDGSYTDGVAFGALSENPTDRPF